MKKRILLLSVTFIFISGFMKAQGVDTNFPDANNQVYAVKYDSVHNNVYVGGPFTVFGASARQRFAVMNATTGALSTWTVTCNAAIWNFYVSGNSLYMVGDFTSVNGQARNYMAKFDITTQTLKSWNPTGITIGMARGVEMHNGKLYVTGVNGSLNNLFRLDTTTAVADAWQPVFTGYVMTLKKQGNFMYAGGSFSDIDGQARGNIAAFDISTSTPTLDAWAPDADSRVNCIDYYNGNVYVSGNFTFIGGAATGYLAEISDAASGFAGNTGWNANANSEIARIKVKGNQLYYFEYPSPLREIYLPTHTATTWSVNFTTNASWNTYGFDLSATKLFMGGGWNMAIQGVSKKYFGVVCAQPYSPIINNINFNTTPSDICHGSNNIPFSVSNSSGATSYNWSINPNETINSFGDNVTVNFSAPSTATQYTIDAYGTNGCINTNTVSTTVNGYDFTSQIAAQSTGFNTGANGNIPCGTQDVFQATDNYLGNGTLSYTWSPGATLSSTSTQTVTSSAKANTKYTLTTTSSEGCSAIDTMTLFVLPFNLTPSSSFGNVLCSTKDTLHVTNDYQGAGVVTYTWSPSASLNLAHSANPTASPVVSTDYTIVASSADGCFGISQNTFITVNSISLSAGNTSGNITCGDVTQLSATNNYPGVGTLTYTWSPSTALNNTHITNPNANPIATTTYTLTLTSPEGCVSTDQTTINVNSLQVNVTNTVSTGCHSPVTLSTNANTGNSNLVYSWTPSVGLNSTTAASPVATIGGNTTYNVTMSLPSSGCSDANNSVNISLTNPNGVSICMVTVDSASTHNVVYWDKTGLANASIDSFRIYREITTNTYQIVGTVHYNSLSVFHDFGANPNVTTYRYKISALDSCGLESPLSLYHNTVYIISVGGGQYTWNPGYTIESSTNPVNNYLLMRDDINNGTWHQVTSTSGSQNTIADPTWSSYPNANWQVVTAWNISCSPTARQSNGTQSAIVKSKSNISNNRSTSVKNTESNFSVYPNPTNGNLTISFANSTSGKVSVKVMSAIGQEVYGETFTQTNENHNVDLSKYENGIYLVQITTTNTTVIKRIVKN